MAVLGLKMAIKAKLWPNYSHELKIWPNQYGPNTNSWL